MYDKAYKKAVSLADLITQKALEREVDVPDPKISTGLMTSTRRAFDSYANALSGQGDSGILGLTNQAPEDMNADYIASIRAGTEEFINRFNKGEGPKSVGSPLDVETSMQGAEDYVDQYEENASFRYDPASLGMIGGVKDDVNVYQPFDKEGKAHAKNPEYKDYSQLFREYTTEEKEGYIPVGELNGKTVYAAPDYARDEDGNYLNVSTADAARMAEEMGSVLPTRDMVKNLYDKAVRIPMPTQPIGETGGAGDPALYTSKINEAIQSLGVEEGAPIVHGKEFFTDTQPTLYKPASAQGTNYLEQIKNSVPDELQRAVLTGIIQTEVGGRGPITENPNYTLNRAYEVFSDSKVNKAFASLSPAEQRKVRAGEPSSALGMAIFDQNYGGGSAYRGRGFVQLTHKGNYQAVQNRLAEKGINVDLVNKPDLVNDPRYAVPVAVAYLEVAGLTKEGVKSLGPAKLNKIVNPGIGRDVAQKRWSNIIKALRSFGQDELADRMQRRSDWKNQ